MKTLAEYLAEYIDQTVGNDNVLPDDISVLKEWIEQGLEAYESVENCTIGICGGDCPECKIPMVRGEAMLYNGHDEIETCQYECPDCGYVVYG
ncbi:hypothetical protein LCGC14_0573930 [marine sediment metagenome]|uniref:Uncharacterized protein n=1 Tax=marine sediment metagenome TaxID=412755 RepID=A0A0F9URJ3_9ZZZZ